MDALREERDALAARVASEGPSGSPYYFYNSILDAQEIIRRHAVADLKPHANYLTNYLGVLIDPKFFPSILDDKAGEVEDAPIPANWHADIAEWGAALRAVDLARENFTVAELGCGWGCWLNNTGVAARRKGLKVHLIGVEGDKGHIAFAREACATNGFTDKQLTLRHGVAATSPGTALFPRQDQAGVNWGEEPLFGATAEQRRSAAEAGTHDEVPMIPLEDLLSPYSRIDLLHIDIQGSEADLVAGCLPTLRDKVAYLVIGTHSRQIEGQLMTTLLQAEWILEIERPAIFSISTGVPCTLVDGVQGWRNPVLYNVS